MASGSQELPVIQKTYDLIVWYVPILNKLPRDQEFILGDRIARGVYDLLDTLAMCLSRDVATHHHDNSGCEESTDTIGGRPTIR